MTSQAAPQAGGGPVTTVMWVVLAAWLGIALYLFSIDRSISRLERKDHER